MAKMKDFKTFSFKTDTKNPIIKTVLIHKTDDTSRLNG